MRTPDPVRQHFKKVETDVPAGQKKYKIERVECVHCNNTCSDSVTRMGNHIRVCTVNNSLLMDAEPGSRPTIPELCVSGQTNQTNSSKTSLATSDIGSYALIMSRDKLKAVQFLFSKAIL